ncbi:MAG TPA: T3SS effector HopA1 family protein [bacterium]|nr:T3SS effector HopA1 family protein [bacterium]
MAVLIPNLSLAGGELQAALGLIQNTQALGPAVGSDQVLYALRAVERLPGAIASEEVARVRHLVQSGAPQEAFRLLAAHRPLLEAAAEQCRTPLAEASALPLERIAAVLGLPAHEFRSENLAPALRPSPAAPLAPDEAARLEVVFAGVKVRVYALARIDHAGHCLGIGLGNSADPGLIRLRDREIAAQQAVIRFVNGRYEIEDPSLSARSTHLNGRRLGFSEKAALKDGDKIRIGRVEFEVRLPYTRRLDSLARRLQSAVDFQGVLAALEEVGCRDMAQKIRGVISSPAPVEERLNRLREQVPQDAGLLIKLESLMLRREAVLLRALYFPTARLDEALALGERLARSLAQSSSWLDLADRLGKTNPEGFRDVIERLERLVSRREAVFAFSEFPNTFGLRGQAARLFMEGLSLGDGQKRDLQYRGVTPDLLAERPWRRIAVPPLMKEALAPFEAVAAQRLGLDWMETTIEASYGEEGEPPTETKVGATAFLMYDKYQAKNPTPSQLLETKTGSSRPEFFEQVRQNLTRDRVPVLPTGYWFYGGTFDPRTRFEGRVYLSLRRRHAEGIFRYLSGVIEPALKAHKGEIQFKIAAQPDGYGRSDSGVIYFHAKDQEAIYRAVHGMNRAHPEFFKEGHPLFTMPLRDERGAVLTGLSFGEHPQLSGVSFGSLRTDAMTTGIRTARALMKTSEPPDWAEMQQIFAYFLSRTGVDLENPAFQKDGRNNFEPLLRLSAAPRPVPAPASVTVDPSVATSLIASELLQRYPALHGAEFRILVERMASDIFKAWQGSGRFPGQTPNAPSHVPEDVLEARVAAAIELMKRQNGPRTSLLAEEMRKTDQGPRPARAVAFRLRQEFSILQEPIFEKLVRALADNVNRTWLAGEPTAEAYERTYQDFLRRLPAWIEANGARSEPLRLLVKELRQKLPAF